MPIGGAATCYALYAASRAIRHGSKEEANKMFRYRIYAQAFTLVAMVGGSFYYAKEREARKEFEGRVSQKRAIEKRDAWIRELEARDREENELQARKEAVRARGPPPLRNSVAVVPGQPGQVVEALTALPGPTGFGQASDQNRPSGPEVETEKRKKKPGVLDAVKEIAGKG
ncbi:MAG: Respiratory supercomplex factor 1, mitochondrial [Phylliscum demangeonii]|nr:MAG: Respiratory supercomplex factor 1, mitochondrial [Phylliscum demangeonii]